MRRDHLPTTKRPRSRALSSPPATSPARSASWSARSRRRSSRRWCRGGGVVLAWWVGLVAGALVALVALRPRWRVLITLGAPLALAACALYVIVQQHRYGYPSDLDWPPQFTRINEIAWLAVILLLADVVVEWLRRRAPDTTDDA